MWAYEAIEHFPDSIALREQLISIFKYEKNNVEVKKLLQEILSIESQNEKSKNMLNSYIDKER